MVLEQGALSSKYNTKNMFPSDSDRGRIYNLMMDKIEKLTEVMKDIGVVHGICTVQVATAWVIEKEKAVEDFSIRGKSKSSWFFKYAC